MVSYKISYVINTYIHMYTYINTQNLILFFFFQILFMWGMCFLKMVSILMNFIENKHETVINYM